MSMKAALFHGVEGGLEIGTCPIPTLQAGDILIKVAAAGLCHSDLVTLSGQQTPKKGYPIIPGHEASGTVEKVGEGVKGFKVGDKVGFLLYYHNCGKCLLCAATPIACPDGILQGFNGDGYFAEYAVVDARSAMLLPEGLDLVESCPLFCAGLTAFHAVDQSELKPDQWIGIVGIGGLGHLAVQYAAKMGLRIAALDIDERKLASAKSLGAEVTFKVKDPKFIDDLRQITGGGVDVAVCLSGSNAAYDTAASIIKPGGTLMCVGINEGRLPIYSVPLANGLIKVKGASSGFPGPMMEKAIHFSAKHNIVPHVTKYRLDDLPEMVKKAKSVKKRTPTTDKPLGTRA
ncbi:uncharacterized protein Z518_04700 [Rhinocladiella mackenziei CBS 650.93]|uniref:Enoyl reductase (ER) domain-containing protein n=1 Tax=Rhinocladiella mackenziei CBS 650.93 TaxID=1442369 RepID=A0A0D2ILS7_9EURO|nr:uncharacterized protein Z518_04700 [Rhinocladiella mackenziei CBS 650.93]KIX06724.1 hypothetical protein Z518_04700 [Rhinocladiella mackenziei CBS 650.93]